MVSSQDQVNADSLQRQNLLLYKLVYNYSSAARTVGEQKRTEHHLYYSSCVQHNFKGVCIHQFPIPTLPHSKKQCRQTSNSKWPHQQATGTLNGRVALVLAKMAHQI